MLLRLHFKVPCTLLSLLLLLTLPQSCREKPLSADDILSDSTGVLRIRTSYYYSASIGGSTFYFSALDTSGSPLNLTADPAEIRSHARTVTAAGFFVSRDGNILTLRSSVRPEIPRPTLRKAFPALRAAFIKYAGSDSGALGDADFTDLNVSAVTSTVAYAASGSLSSSALGESETVRISGIEGVDLALLQLKSKLTPRGRYVFHFALAARGRRTLLETFLKRMERNYDKRRLSKGTHLFLLGIGNASAVNGKNGAGQRVMLVPGIAIATPGEYTMPCTFTGAGNNGGAPVLNVYGDVVGIVSAVPSAGKSGLHHVIQSDRIKEFMNIEEE